MQRKNFVLKLHILLTCFTLSMTKKYIDCDCGKKNSSILGTRVAGGGEADVGEYPWAALLKIYKNGQEYICGGTLVNDRFVITAAHCVDHHQTDTIEIVLGEHNRKLYHETNAFRTVAKRDFAVHNSYKDYLEWKGYVDFDIALLELEKPVDFLNYQNIRPACLPSSSDVSKTFPSETYGTVIGWGYSRIVRYDGGKGVYDRTSHSDVLNELEDVKLINRKDCDDIFDKTIRQVKVPASALCGVSITGDSCQGDSGSGLVVMNQQTRSYELIGIVSYGVGCNSTIDGTKLPGVYTNMRNKFVHQWVEQRIYSGTFCTSSPSSSPSGTTTSSSTTAATSGWSQWTEFTPCVRWMSGLGKKTRERECSDGTGESCGRLKQVQDRVCIL